MSGNLKLNGKQNDSNYTIFEQISSDYTELSDLLIKLPVIDIKSNIINSANRIHLFAETFNDGTGDYAWIFNYIKAFENMGYVNENINIWVMNDSIPNSEHKKEFLNDYLNNLKYILADCKTEYLYDTTDSITMKINDKNILINKIENFINEDSSNSYGHYLYGKLNEINDNDDKMKRDDKIRRDDNMYINTTDFFNNYKPNEINNITTQIDEIMKEKYPSMDEFASTEMLTCEKKSIDENNKKIIADNLNGLLFFLKTMKEYGYIQNVKYYIFSLFGKGPLINNSNPDACFISDMDYKNDIFIIYSTNYHKLFFPLLSKCNKIIGMSEGGVIMTYPGNKFISSGIGKYQLGITNSGPVNLRPESTHIDDIFHVSKSKVMKYLSELTPGETVKKYHAVYIGQIDTEYASTQVIKFYIFISLLMHKYRSITEDTEIYVFVNSKIKDTPHTFYQNDILNEEIQYYMGLDMENGVFTNEIDYHFHVDPETKTMDIKMKKMLIKIRYYNRFKNKISDIINNINHNESAKEITFSEFLYYAEPIVATTGDASYQEAISLGKSVFHDYISHKRAMVDSIYNTLINYTILKEKEFGVVDKMIDYRKSRININHFYKRIADIKIHKIKIYSCEILRQYYDDLLTGLLENKYYTSFINHIVKPYYNFIHNFNVLIYLVANDIVKFKNFHGIDEHTMIGWDESIQKPINEYYDVSAFAKLWTDINDVQHLESTSNANELLPLKGGMNTYYYKYIKYKSKYHKLLKMKSSSK